MAKGKNIVVNRLTNLVQFAVDKASGERAKRFGMAVGKAFIATGAAITATSAVLAKFAQKAVTAFNDSIKMANELGISVNQLNEYEFAMNAVGGSVTDFTAALGHLEGVMKDAANGNHEAKETFRLMGLSIYDTNGNLKDSGDMFREYTDRLGKLTKQGDRTAGMTRGLGKEFARLNPDVNKLNKNLDYARRHGTPIGQKDIQSVERYREAVAKTTFAFKGVSDKIALVVLPAVEKTLEKFNDWITVPKNVEKIDSAVRTLGKGLELLTTPLGTATVALGGVMSLIAGGAGIAAMLGVAATPIGLVAAAIGGVASSLYAAYAIYDQFTRTAKGENTVLKQIADYFGLGAEAVEIATGWVKIFGIVFTRVFKPLMSEYIIPFIEGLGHILRLLGKISLTPAAWLTTTAMRGMGVTSGSNLGVQSSNQNYNTVSRNETKNIHVANGAVVVQSTGYSAQELDRLASTIVARIAN